MADREGVAFAENAYDIEPAFLVAEVMPSEEILCHRSYGVLFQRSDRLLGKAIRPAHPALHLAEHHAGSILCDKVDLAVAASIV
jgi:hypothetical protein